MVRSLHFSFHKIKTQKGFTLIELLVVLVLLGLFVGGTLANYRRLKDRKIVEGAAKQAEQALRGTQKLASAGVKPAGVECDDPETLVSYTISMSGTSYSIQANCSGGDLVTVSNNLPVGAEFAAEATMVFAVLPQRASGDSSVCVQDDAGSLNYVIEVDPGGAVSFAGEGSCPAMVVLNSATWRTCNSICSDYSLSCSSVGTNPDGTGNNQWRRFAGCFQVAANCGSLMGGPGGLCAGSQTRWTNCRCEP